MSVHTLADRIVHRGYLRPEGGFVATPAAPQVS